MPIPGILASKLSAPWVSPKAIQRGPLVQRLADSSSRLVVLRAPVQTIEAERDITPGDHVYAVDFVVDGPSTDPNMPGFGGTATLYVDDEAVGSGPIVTQPGYFCLVGDGICVGRDSASPVTPDYADRGVFTFTGGVIDKVVVDVTGEHYVDHEAQVRAWLLKD